jgi:prophage regulatory protein
MRVLSFPELKTEKGIRFSRAHIWRLVRASQFPEPIKLGVQTNAWNEAEIDAWLEARAAARRQAGAEQGRAVPKPKGRSRD